MRLLYRFSSTSSTTMTGTDPFCFTSLSPSSLSTASKNRHAVGIRSPPVAFVWTRSHFGRNQPHSGSRVAVASESFCNQLKVNGLLCFRNHRNCLLLEQSYAPWAP